MTGDTLSTRAGQVALRLRERRVAADRARSEVVLTSANAAELVSRCAVFRLRESRAGAEFSVTTPFGTVRDMGTQFVARLNGGSPARRRRPRRSRHADDEGASDTAAAGERLVTTRTRPPSAARPCLNSAATGIGRNSSRRRSTSTAAPSAISSRGSRRKRDASCSEAPQPSARERATLSGSIDLEPLQKLAAVLTPRTSLTRSKGNAS